MWKPCGLDVARLTISTRAWDASRLLPEMYIKPFHSGRPATSRRIVAPLGCQEPMARGRMNQVCGFGECFPTLAVGTGGLLFDIRHLGCDPSMDALALRQRAPVKEKVAASGARSRRMRAAEQHAQPQCSHQERIFVWWRASRPSSFEPEWKAPGVISKSLLKPAVAV